MSILRKAHADPGNNGMDFVLSDATPDRYGDVIEASGWDLANFSKNPIALFNHNSDFPIGRWENLSVKNGALRGTLRMAPKGSSPRIDELHSLIDAGILRAVSVGFRPIESSPIGKGYGERYLKSELVETSLVSVPANPNALAIAKSLNVSRETLDVVFAKHGTEDDGTVRRNLKGENASHSTSSSSTGNKSMSGLVKRIEDTQTKILDLRAQLDAHIASGADDDAATETTNSITGQLTKAEESLEALKRAEVQLSRAAGVTPPVRTTLAVSSSAQPEAQVVQEVRSFAKPFAQPTTEKTRPSDFIFKALAADVKHFGDGRKDSILKVIEREYGTQREMGDQVRKVMSLMVTKAAAIPADTTTSGWADTLAATVIGDFIESLLPISVYPQLRAKGGSFTFGRNGTISLPARTTSTTVAGSFVAQGAAIPVRQGAFSAITLTPKKMGVITTMTREITEHSTPQIEAILRQAMQEDTAVALDTVLLDATASSTTRPAGLKNGISKISPSATASIVGFVADCKALMAALITATNGNVRSPAWIMNPGDVLAASMLQTTTGDTPFREEIAGGTLFGIPIIQSTTGLSDMMGIIDAADFITATGDTPQFSVSDQAVLHMEDTSPTALSTVATPNTVAAPIRSLWQTDTLAIRMLMDVNWAKRRTGIFQWTDTMVWN